MSSAGGPKERRRAFEKELLGQLWEGKVETAIALLRGTLEWVRNPAAVEELIAYLEKRRAYIPHYQQRQQAGLWIASTRVEKYNDWAVSGCCKHQGMSWSPRGVLALARWKPRDATVNSTIGVGISLPERALPEPIRILEDGFGDVRILSGQEAGLALDEGDAAAEPAECLGELHADGAAAEDDQVPGHPVQFQGRHVRERVDEAQAGDLRNSGPGAGVDEDTARVEPPRPALRQRHLDGPGGREPSLAEDEVEATGLEARAIQVHHARDHVALAAEDPGPRRAC